MKFLFGSLPASVVIVPLTIFSLAIAAVSITALLIFKMALVKEEAGLMNVNTTLMVIRRHL